MLQRLADRLSRSHPDVLDRLSDVGTARLLLVATDLPWSALITFTADGAEVTLSRTDAESAPEAEATVTGPVERLVACAQGGGDGDAMFFAREIQVTGNSDVLVALRNALDGAELDVGQEFAALAGPLQRPATDAIGGAAWLYRRMADGLDSLKAEIRAPLQNRLDTQAQEIAQLRAEVQRLRRRQPRSSRASSTVSAQGDVEVPT
nr:SCP2 sterol-binding domain-containing protein [Rhodovibrio salinarum]